MLRYMIVREVPALSADGSKQYIVKLVLNREQHCRRIERRLRELLGEERYTVDVHEGLRKALKEIEDDYENEKMQFA